MATLWKVDTSIGQQIYVVATDVLDAVRGVLGVRGVASEKQIHGIEYVDTCEVTDASAELAKTVNAIGAVDLFAVVSAPIVPTPCEASDVPFGGDLVADAEAVFPHAVDVDAETEAPTEPVIARNLDWASV